MKVTTDSCLFGAWVAEEMKNAKGKIQNALDIGCGTGLLSFMVAQKNNLVIDAVEIDRNAAQQATENSTASPWKDRISIFHEDVLQWQTSKQFDCILSNPPFYESELRSETNRKNLAHHDAGLTLASLVSFIAKRLKEEGIFYLLLPSKREAEFSKLADAHHLHLRKKVYVRQSGSHQPFRIMMEGSKHPDEQVIETEITIKNENDEYTPAFIALLKDYYLYL